MARAIDAEKYMELLKEQYLHNKSMGNSQATRAWQGAMQLLYDMPTLTPQNEPLTIKELREMDGEPVYIIIDGVEPLKMWVLVEIDGADIYLTNNLGGRSSYEETIRLYKFKLYRRPPERQEDTDV